jgi:YqeY-like protein
MNNIINMIKEIKMLSYQELKNQNMNAMRNKDKKLQSVLSTLIGKIDNEGKLRMANLTPEQEEKIVLEAIQSSLKAMQKAKADFGERANSEYLEKVDFEISVLKGFLPQQITGQELEDLIQSYIQKEQDSGADKKALVGLVMKALKAEHNGRYDGREASTILNRLK